jgi:hypothetical protein
MKKPAINFHSLIAAVIDRAILDLKRTGPKCHPKEIDQAMAFILSDCCEGWCLELEIDYRTIRETAAGLYRRAIETETTKPRKYRKRLPCNPPLNRFQNGNGPRPTLPA